MAWFKKTKEIRTEKKGKTPEGLWVKCDGCKEIIYKKEIEKNLKICPKCNYHFRISARERLKLLVDEGSFIETDESLESLDPLNFKDSVSYNERLRDNQKKTGLKEAVISGDALIKGNPGVPFYATCVTCHDPHGTTLVEATRTSNRMVRDKWTNPPTLCRQCHY